MRAGSVRRLRSCRRRPAAAQSARLGAGSGELGQLNFRGGHRHRLETALASSSQRRPRQSDRWPPSVCATQGASSRPVLGDQTHATAGLAPPLRDVDVVRFIKMAEMRRFLSGVAFQDPSLRNYVTEHGLAMSAFEYAYRNADIAAEIGASFNGDGHLRPTTRRPEGIAASLTD